MKQLNGLKPAVYAVFIVFIVVIYFSKQQQEKNQPPALPQKESTDKVATLLIYTKHARCRMQCRDITESEIASVINEGNVNKAKSDATDRPCPTLAYEGKGTDGHHLRVVIADCDERDKVVTVIDLDEDHPCDCK